MNGKRVVKQWGNWQLVCIASEEYSLIRHDGFNVDFIATDEKEAISEAMRLMLEIDGGSTAIQ